MCVDNSHPCNDNFGVSSGALVSSRLAGRLGSNLLPRLGLGELSASVQHCGDLDVRRDLAGKLASHLKSGSFLTVCAPLLGSGCLLAVGPWQTPDWRD